MLLCGHDPKEAFKPEHAAESGSDASPGEQYDALLSHFEEEAVLAQQHRTLLDWLDVARRAELRYDPWIDFYVKENRLGEVAAAVVPEPEIAAAASGDRCAGNEIELASSDLPRVAAQLDVSSPASASAPAIPAWKLTARAYAYQFDEEMRLKGLRADQRTISAHVAARMRKEGVRNENRTFPSPETLRRHVLFPLQPPSGAKLVQVAQIEQDPK